MEASACDVFFMASLLREECESVLHEFQTSELPIIPAMYSHVRLGTAMPNGLSDIPYVDAHCYHSISGTLYPLGSKESQ